MRSNVYELMNNEEHQIEDGLVLHLHEDPKIHIKRKHLLAALYWVLLQEELGGRFRSSILHHFFIFDFLFFISNECTNFQTRGQTQSFIFLGGTGVG